MILVPLASLSAADIAGGSRQFVFKTNDVIAITGGANAVNAQECGYLEVLLGVALPDRNLRFRNIAWEGDTVYAQPRDLNFGPWRDQLKKTGASVIFAQFGQMESLQGPSSLPQFVAAYEKLLDEFLPQTDRIVLVSPFPFEKASPPLPDLSARNDSAREYAAAIRQIAERHNCFFVDLFTPLRARTNSAALTRAGVQLNQSGQWVTALELTRQLGLDPFTNAIHFVPSTGGLAPAAADELRQSVLARNRVWFDYWRPMNWAFLAGDRIEQPSSRDYRDPKIRWFPAEMNQFPPLIEASEREIAAKLAALCRELK